MALCSRCTYPSIHFSLDEDTLKITVGCPVCGVVCGVVCVVRCGGVLCGMCDVYVHVVVWCCVVLACCREHVVVLVVRVCVCGVWCGVRLVWSVCVVVFGVRCGVCVWFGVCECVGCGTAWCAEKPPVLMSSTPPCVYSKCLRVQRQDARMCQHAGVLSLHMKAF